MFEVFAMIDGNSPGTTAEDDRRVSYNEWCSALEDVKEAGYTWAPFVNLKKAGTNDFYTMDENHGGFVLLDEFCRWIEKGEIKAGTEIGIELSIGDDD